MPSSFINYYILHLIYSSEAAKAAARTPSSDQKYNRAWEIWNRFLARIELEEDVFLDSISTEWRPTIIGGFA